MTIPALPERGLLADLCREVAAAEGVQPQLVEKDFYLTRLLWALAERLGEKLLLKGGTLLSKVDLGFFRMSEDADLVLPGSASRQKGTNARRLQPIRAALLDAQDEIGGRLELPGGEASERHAHVLWHLEYPSEFGPQRILVEVTLRPLLRPPRRVALGQLLVDPLLGDYRPAFCWALDADEARAEKVRAAHTRDAIRDFYDLARLADQGADFTSRKFITLVDEKLAELGAEPLAKQPASFGLTPARRAALEASLRRELPAVLRRGAPGFELDAMLAGFDRKWKKVG
jgi:predicted nucleotidyltransferase component of viral defense system